MVSCSQEQEGCRIMSRYTVAVERVIGLIR